MESNLTTAIETPHNFSFRATLLSHGWPDLLPFELDREAMVLYYTFPKAPKLKIYSPDDNDLRIECEHAVGPEIIAAVRRMFRLDENFDDIYRLAAQNPAFGWVIEKQAGRLVRSPELWEDMVKLLFTTNCSWGMTRAMVRNLVEKLGEGRYFPDARQIANVDEEFLRKEIKCGYRAPYLLQLARDFSSGRIDTVKIENRQSDADDVYKYLRTLKGFGHYAVSSLMKLAGYYNFPAIDSWNRARFFEKRNGGKPCPDRVIREHYKPFAPYAGLFFWLDVTENYIN